MIGKEHKGETKIALLLVFTGILERFTKEVIQCFIALWRVAGV
jgi:hypothetical protein